MFQCGGKPHGKDLLNVPLNGKHVMNGVNIRIFGFISSRVMLASLLLVCIVLPVSAADDWKSVLDLRGKWKFELGDKEEYASPGFDDSKWEEIFVPAKWEDEGYAGYQAAHCRS